MSAREAAVAAVDEGRKARWRRVARRASERTSDVWEPLLRDLLAHHDKSCVLHGTGLISRHCIEADRAREALRG